MNRLFVNDKGSWREMKRVLHRSGREWVEVPREQWPEHMANARSQWAIPMRIAFGLLAVMAFVKLTSVLITGD